MKINITDNDVSLAIDNYNKNKGTFEMTKLSWMILIAICIFMLKAWYPEGKENVVTYLLFYANKVLAFYIVFIMMFSSLALLFSKTCASKTFETYIKQQLNKNKKIKNFKEMLFMSPNSMLELMFYLILITSGHYILGAMGLFAHCVTSYKYKSNLKALKVLAIALIAIKQSGQDIEKYKCSVL